MADLDLSGSARPLSDFPAVTQAAPPPGGPCPVSARPKPQHLLPRSLPSSRPLPPGQGRAPRGGQASGTVRAPTHHGATHPRSSRGAGGAHARTRASRPQGSSGTGPAGAAPRTPGPGAASQKGPGPRVRPLRSTSGRRGVEATARDGRAQPVHTQMSLGNRWPRQRPSPSRPLLRRLFPPGPGSPRPRSGPPPATLRTFCSGDGQRRTSRPEPRQEHRPFGPGAWSAPPRPAPPSPPPLLGSFGPGAGAGRAAARGPAGMGPSCASLPPALWVYNPF